MNDELKNLLGKIDSLKKTLDSARPLLNETILNAINIEYTYDSNRIEGNTLTLRETDIVINKGLTIGGKSMREHLEANNHYEAILYIRDLVKDDALAKAFEMAKQKIRPTRLSGFLGVKAYRLYVEVLKNDYNAVGRTFCDAIKGIHAIVLRGIDRDNAGKYRSVPVAISGSRHTPPQPWQVPKLKEDLQHWIQKEAQTLHPVIFAAEIHERIATIHPFIDGNGRTARLLMNLVLLQNGYTITNIPGDAESRLSYYNALEKCNLDRDKTEFLNFIAEHVKTSLESMLKKLGTKP
jgi:cell filamentation protein, protein adenylyltransferase